MGTSTQLVMLIKNMYFMGRKRFLLPVTYFPTKLVYPFTLRVMVIKIGADYASKCESAIYDVI